MRRRLSTLALAVTGLVVVAYTVPLGILVRNQADERARTAAEQLVQDVARSMVPVVSRSGDVDIEAIRQSVQVPDTVAVLASDGTVLGSNDFDDSLAELTVAEGGSVSRYSSDGSWQVSLPVIGQDGWAVVSAVVSADDLTRGVWRAWSFLLILGIGLIATALLLSDRLGRSLRDPVEDLAAAARRLGTGDLSARVELPDITELSVVADALNHVAPQLRNLLVSERESVADLSHRLRTPLAALRLQAEAITDEDERASMLMLVDRMQSSVDRLIIDARKVDAEARCDLAAVAAQRGEFWSVLAEEEGRRFDRTIPSDVVIVQGSAADVGDAIDVLIGNVFSHTERGTAFALSVDMHDGRARATVADEGPGFPVDMDPLRRGESGAGSTGLGLDIAKTVVNRMGGTISIDSSPQGGGQVVLTMVTAAADDHQL